MTKHSIFSSVLFRIYAIDRRIVRKLVMKILRGLEGGPVYSSTLRRIFREYHRVEVGMYTHGPIFKPYVLDKYTTVGRYCSFAEGVRVINRNHPLDNKSTHALFFNPHFKIDGGPVEDTLEHTPLEIGHDVWVGANALILPPVRSIGTGAVIAAGSVLSRDVPPYGVVVGNPARLVRYRFPPEVIEELLASRWWEKPIEEQDMKEFAVPLVKPESEERDET